MAPQLNCSMVKKSMASKPLLVNHCCSLSSWKTLGVTLKSIPTVELEALNLKAQVWFSNSTLADSSPKKVRMERPRMERPREGRVDQWMDLQQQRYKSIHLARVQNILCSSTCLRTVDLTSPSLSLMRSRMSASLPFGKTHKHHQLTQLIRMGAGPSK